MLFRSYASIVLKNSIYLTEIQNKAFNIYKYIEAEGVYHAKMYYRDGRSWMIYTKGNYIVGDYIKATDGFLLCDVGPIIGTYKFSILGLSHICGLDSQGQTINTCYYETEVNLEVIKYTYNQSIAKAKNDGLFYGLITGVILIAMIIILIVLIVKNNHASVLLDEYRRLPVPGQGTDNKLVAITPSK